MNLHAMNVFIMLNPSFLMGYGFCCFYIKIHTFENGIYIQGRNLIFIWGLLADPEEILNEKWHRSSIVSLRSHKWLNILSCYRYQYEIVTIIIISSWKNLIKMEPQLWFQRNLNWTVDDLLSFLISLTLQNPSRSHIRFWLRLR
jgi:hypothetical protein